jgi:hypothetical protein
MAMYHPWRSQRPTDLASGYILAKATPAEEPNQTIDPPNPTCVYRKPKLGHIGDEVRQGIA